MQSKTSRKICYKLSLEFFEIASLEKYSNRTHMNEPKRNARAFEEK